MVFESVDQLQKVLSDKVFVYAKDSKKAAGRALGTLVEIITFYLLKSWGFEYAVTIERGLEEYGNPEITHNVEYSLHPILHKQVLLLPPQLPISSTRILSALSSSQFSIAEFERTGTTLLTKDGILRNSCVIANGSKSHLVAVLEYINSDQVRVVVMEQHSKPYAMFECKRVGVEEGMRKGPQTIEKAKQGAYVANSVSCLQKIRTPTGELRGLIYIPDGSFYSKPYAQLVAEVIASSDVGLLRDFILTVGVVSNHGNWFTSENHNKELKVLAQSYDWLLFLTDKGLSEFITELLLEPKPLLNPARDAFLSSYAANKIKNQFTKVQMNYKADQVLQTYFRENAEKMRYWFNIIAPKNESIEKLQLQISTLREKDWRKVHEV